MEINLYSGNYRIISSGQTILFGPNADFKIYIASDTDFAFSVIIKFKSDIYNEQRIEKKVSGEIIELNCFNFEDSGTGLSKPISIARIGEKDIYLMFWAYLEGNAKIRSVKYTIYEGMYKEEFVDEK